jgi:hypothetical protein
MSLIGSGLCAGLAAPLIIIFILIVIYRANFTDIWRDKRYWNRRTFEGKYGKIPVPLCPGALSGMEKEMQSVQNSVSDIERTTAQEISSISQNIS